MNMVKRPDLASFLQKLHDEICLFKFIELETCLSDLIEMKIDLVTKTALKPRIGVRITREVIPV